MAQVLTRQFRSDEPGPRPALPGARALRVAAATLNRAPAPQMSSTTVVIAVAGDDLDGFHALVADIAALADLDARVSRREGTCVVRFSRRRPAEVEPVVEPLPRAIGPDRRLGRAVWGGH
jgi:hypothetical protein